ncbi:MAG TPA: hypothetical protein VK154_04570 [Chitinophagales bacterium]|nr:hypothetical protein [Chitinophagales bacterium]
MGSLFCTCSFIIFKNRDYFCYTTTNCKLLPKKELQHVGFELIDDHLSAIIEKAKEIIVYRQLRLSEIAVELNYSSIAHLSSQFKKTTGLTRSHYKEAGAARRKALDKI